MGIPTCRLIGQNHENFVCAICLDVATDPVSINDCEHFFCRSCIDQPSIKACPNCNQQLKNPKWTSLSRASRRFYLDLKIRCLNPFCDHVSDVNYYEHHDKNCSETFDFCSNCGYKSRRSNNETHSCLHQVREDCARKILEMERKLQQMEKKLLKMEPKIRNEILAHQKVTNDANEKLNQRLIAIEKSLKDGKEQCKAPISRYNYVTPLRPDWPRRP